MQKDMDKIQFESRSEIESVMAAINKYVKQNPKEKRNEPIARLYDLLDCMHMEW